MPAILLSYDDWYAIYRQEASAYYRGVQARRLPAGHIFDATAQKKPSLSRIERRNVWLNEPDPMIEYSKNLGILFDSMPDKTPRKSREATQRAARRGGAATKAAWARRKAQRGRIAA